MRSPWTALRETQARIGNETDERAELVMLRRRHRELATVVTVGGVGALVLLGRPLGLREAPGTTWSAAVLALAGVVLVAWLLARVATRRRYGTHMTPERDRAETLRSLLLAPVLPVVAGAVHWWVGGDLATTVPYVGMTAVAVVGGLGLRLWLLRESAPDGDGLAEM